jgi:hypothetical protein
MFLKNVNVTRKWAARGYLGEPGSPQERTKGVSAALLNTRMKLPLVIEVRLPTAIPALQQLQGAVLNHPPH